MKKLIKCTALLMIAVLSVIPLFLIKANASGSNQQQPTEEEEQENNGGERALESNFLFSTTYIGYSATSNNNKQAQIYIEINNDILTNTNDYYICGYSTTASNMTTFNTGISVRKIGQYIQVDTVNSSNERTTEYYALSNLQLNDVLLFCISSTGTYYLYHYRYINQNWQNIQLIKQYTTTKNATWTFNKNIALLTATKTIPLNTTYTTFDSNYVLAIQSQTTNTYNTIYIDQAKYNNIYIKEWGEQWENIPQGNRNVLLARIYDGESYLDVDITLIQNSENAWLHCEYYDATQETITDLGTYKQYNKNDLVTIRGDNSTSQQTTVTINVVKQKVEVQNNSITITYENKANFYMVTSPIDKAIFYNIASGYNTTTSQTQIQIAQKICGQTPIGALKDAYDVGKQEGYESGLQGQTAITPFFAIIGNIFGGIGDILEIELAPHLPLGIFIAIPLFFGAVGFIFWLWRRSR